MRDKRKVTVQTLMFDQSLFSVSRAKQWALQHGYSAGKVDRPMGAERDIRLRQANQDEFTDTFAVEYGNGVSAIVGTHRGQPMKRNPTDHATRFYDTEFVSGQEPDVDGAYRNDDFGTIMETRFQLTADDLAKMLGKQRRVLSRALDNLTETQAFYALVNSKQGKKVLSSFRAAAKRLLEEDIDAATDDPGIFRAEGVQVDWYDDGSYEFWAADIDADRKQIKFITEMEVIGTWETR
tara:strand:+ start:5530 stop:6240 length:711 start_codon:yes stop_codon:yes gene_type:complete